AILSGILCVACFPPFNQNWLCWIALTPLIAAVWFSGKNSKRRWLRNLLLGYVAGIVFFTGTFSWLGSLGTLFDNFWLHGLSFMVVFANVIALTTVRRLILEARTRAMRPHYDLTLTMAAIVGVLAFGVHIAQNPSPTKPLRVAAVQAGIPQRQKFDPQFAKEIFGQFTRLSEIALRLKPPPDLLIWPESSMPEPVRDENTESYQFVMDFSG